MNVNSENMRGKKVLIVGMGRSGIAATQAMLKLGAEVHIQDSKSEEGFDAQMLTFLRDKNVTSHFNCLPCDMGYFDMLIVSPGVTTELPFIQEAHQKGAEIIGELEIAYRVGRGNYVAITGTNGKTTTTMLVGEIFRRAKRKTHVVGNIGVAVISAALDAKEDSWLVTETSSFQLETTRYFKPFISAILNLSPDHLNRHHTMKAYGEAKAKIFANQTEEGYLIINADSKECMALSKGCRAKIIYFSRKKEPARGAFVKDGKIVVKTESEELTEICSIDEIKIIGDHNLENVLAAAAIAFFSGINGEIIGDAIRAFPGVEHRIEFCSEVEGVRYYNDSKATNTDAAITALKAIKKDIVLIAGGDAKEQSFDEFAECLKGRVKKMVLLGRDAGLIGEAAEKAGFTDYVFCKDMEECVRKAYETAEAGDSVLMSPACASWDMYDNFEQRGKHFKDCVDRL